MTMGVVIIGAGLIGRSIAYYLSRTGAQVILLDATAPAAPGAADTVTPATQASLGILTRPTAGTDGLSTFYRHSHALHASLAAELKHDTGIDVGWRAPGGLALALAPGELDGLAARLRSLRARGVAASPLSPAQVRAREPSLGTPVVGGWSFPGDHRLDPVRLSAALWQAAADRGAGRRAGARVAAVEPGTPAQVVLAGGDRIEAETVVIAAGAGSGPLLDALGVTPPAVRPAPGQSLRLRAGRRPRYIIHWQGYHLLAAGPHELLVGATVDPLSPEAVATPSARAQLLAVARRLLGVEAVVCQHRAGLRPKPRQGRPVIGPVAGRPGVWVASGHYKSGVLMAPATGQALARWITGGDPGMDMGCFAVRR